MNEQVIRLIYPPSMVDQPVISQLLRTYSELTINILRAEIGPAQGWMEAQIVGNPGLIQNAIAWLRTKGIEVQTLGA